MPQSIRTTPMREPRIMPARAPTEREFEGEGAGEGEVELLGDGDEPGLVVLEREIAVAAKTSWSLGKS